MKSKVTIYATLGPKGLVPSSISAFKAVAKRWAKKRGPDHQVIEIVAPIPKRTTTRATV